MLSSEFDFDVVTGPSVPHKPSPQPAPQPAPQRPR